MTYVRKVNEIITTGKESTLYLKKGNQYSEYCEKVIQEIL